MTSIKDIFSEFGPEYLESHTERIPNEHRKVIQAIIDCRSGELGFTLYLCRSCEEYHLVNRSCGNRHCPNCQHHKTQKWLIKQQSRALPTHYFLITFTVPEELRDFIRSNQKVAYHALFQASSDALKRLANDPRFVGTELPGFFGVLQTWGRQLQYHPHIHYIVPGGGLTHDRTRWLPSREDFYVPVQALSPIYRAKFRDAMRKAGLLDRINPKVWTLGWNVDSQAVGGSDTSLKYLAPYVFKVAISNSRIVKVENRAVTFKYREHRTHRYRTTSLDVLEFIRRFLQHVLPHGFMKVRHYGFLSASARNCALSMEEISNMIQKDHAVRIPATQPQALPGPRCPNCGGILIPLSAMIPTARGQPTLIPARFSVPIRAG